LSSILFKRCIIAISMINLYCSI